MEKQMLDVFFYAIIVGIISTAVIVGIGKKLGGRHCDIPIKGIIASILVQAIAVIILLYVFCIEQTLFGILRWLWPAFLVDVVVFFIADDQDEEYGIVSLICTIVLGIVCISTLFMPKQTMVYIHEVEDEKIAYTISTNELVAKLNLQIDKYRIDEPEMRKIKGKDVAVYQIHDDGEGPTTEYIPGYAIQEVGQFPKFVSKKIYFDISYSGERDALRRVRKEYPTLIIGAHKFDVDDDGNPYEVYLYREKMHTPNGNDYGLITIDLRDGNCEKYPADEIPKWIDFKSTEPK